MKVRIRGFNLQKKYPRWASWTSVESSDRRQPSFVALAKDKHWAAVFEAQPTSICVDRQLFTLTLPWIDCLNQIVRIKVDTTKIGIKVDEPTSYQSFFFLFPFLVSCLEKSFLSLQGITMVIYTTITLTNFPESVRMCLNYSGDEHHGSAARPLHSTPLDK